MQHRYDFAYLFDATDSNPNGDPDAGNLPRIDPETGQGLVTDVCLKRKIRNYIGLVKKEDPPYEIYVKEKAVLNRQHQRAYDELKLEPVKKKLPKKTEDAQRLTSWMCKNFFDIRAFGAVMSTEVNCGQVRGPVQFGFARSIHPIVTLEHAITVCAARKEDKPVEEQIGIQGRKFTVPYGLYRVHGYINPHLAEQTGFDSNSEDLELFWTSLAQMFENDRSAARTGMAPQALVVFQHESTLGNAPAHKLFERIVIERMPSDNGDDSPARRFADYVVTVDESNLPEGITVIRKF